MNRSCRIVASKSSDRVRRARYNRRMYTPQAGIFALGTSSHAYLEFDVLNVTKREEFAAKIAAIREPRTTTGGVNFVIGLRPELWSGLVPGDMPRGVEGFNKEILGVERFVMPNTQHDALVWLSGSAYDVLFDMARSVVRDMAGLATLADETTSWPYRHDRDLTGFTDGSENPHSARRSGGRADTGWATRCRRLGAVAAEVEAQGE